jgi:predicted RNase H-like nuclease (RuvC/YqgF family)
MGVAVSSGPSFAQSEQSAKEVGETVDKTVEVHRETQRKQDAWSREQADLSARYRTAKANVDYLEKRKAFEEKEAAALDARIAELERRMVESVRLNDSLLDTLNTVVARVEAFVEGDLPFLLEERRARIASVKEAIAKPDLTGAEKLRRVLEVLQVEANYGNLVEVYQEKIMVGEEQVFADMVRVGRLSVYWRTPDGERVGEFDRGTHAWVELDEKYVHVINETREMALRLRSTEIVSLPLGRITP